MHATTAQLATRQRAWTIHSQLDVATHYTRKRLLNFWRCNRGPFFFCWETGHVFMRTTPQQEGHHYEEIRSMRDLLNRAHRGGDR